MSLAFAAWLAFPPGDPFPDDYSRLVLDREGGLLRATLASDNQYRFPPEATPLPDKYKAALLTSEDKRFYLHPGVDPLALANAALTNLRAGGQLRGGSTITMQVERLAHPKARTYMNKILECARALKLSLHFPKEEILRLYAAHAPMGGNVVGVQSASYIYYGRPATELTWAEAALLAVLPNSPSMINLERERPALVRKRNRLLRRLEDEGHIDRTTRELACSEPLPGAGGSLPFRAPHLTTLVLSRERGSRRIETTLDRDVQARVERAARLHAGALAHNGVRNLAVIAAETATGAVRAYVGSQGFFDSGGAGQVDGVQAWRSTGSLLKPFLVALALDRGPYTTKSLIRDVPTFYGTFAPQNASKDFAGLVTIEELLVKSLNVPAVRLLNAYGHRDFHYALVDAGLEGLFRGPDGYGLTLVLGGAEASLYELARLYLCLGSLGARRDLAVIREAADQGPPGNSSAPGSYLVSSGSAWQVLDVLSELSRPGVEHYWNLFSSKVPVAWKTGTSYGQKDAWAIGVNAQWTIGVWAGNFDGEGNATLTGAGSAAPLLFTLFNMLTKADRPVWPDKPERDLSEVLCCAESGYPAGPHCKDTVTLERPRRSSAPGRCPFHRSFLVDPQTGRSVCSLCWEGVEPEKLDLFVVSPPVRDVLSRTGRRVDPIPVHAGRCPTVRDHERMTLIYPPDGASIFVPRNFTGSYEKVVLSAAHQRPSAHMFWYLNRELVGETLELHQLPLALRPGLHRLTILDETGLSKSVSFAAYREDE